MGGISGPVSVCLSRTTNQLELAQMSAYDTTQPTAPRMDLLDALIAGYVLSPADTPAVSANFVATVVVRQEERCVAE